MIRQAGDKFQRAASALRVVADEFRGEERDLISRAIHLLEMNASSDLFGDIEKPAGKYAAPGDEDF